ncbi:hypothetical protein AV521_45910 [Streptomyces sp. IMTB 2501]|nr:hypothetical protein AV521_45910 [Streptomyces sp. IMTB 2501]
MWRWTARSGRPRAPRHGGCADCGGRGEPTGPGSAAVPAVTAPEDPGDVGLLAGETQLAAVEPAVEEGEHEKAVRRR